MDETFARHVNLGNHEKRQGRHHRNDKDQRAPSLAATNVVANKKVGTDSEDDEQEPGGSWDLMSPTGHRFLLRSVEIIAGIQSGCDDWVWAGFRNFADQLPHMSLHANGLHADLRTLLIIHGLEELCAQTQILLQYVFCLLLMTVLQQGAALKGIADGDSFVFLCSYSRVVAANSKRQDKADQQTE